MSTNRKRSGPCRCDGDKSGSDSAGISLGNLLFLISLGLILMLYAGLILGRISSYPGGGGFRVTGASEEDPARGAKAYLQALNKTALSQPLAQILSDPNFVAVETQPHALLGRTAPDFELGDERGRRHRLETLLNDGPVVLVFYYGYYCSHCVAQLFALNDDLRLFDELGAKVVALSADPPETTSARFAQYGRFEFPVLSDPANRIAAKYGVYRAPSANEPEELLHGTFLIDERGIVLWANTGTEPFVDNKTLLMRLAGRRKKEAATHPNSQ